MSYGCFGPLVRLRLGDSGALQDHMWPDNPGSTGIERHGGRGGADASPVAALDRQLSVFLSTSAWELTHDDGGDLFESCECLHIALRRWERQIGSTTGPKCETSENNTNNDEDNNNNAGGSRHFFSPFLDAPGSEAEWERAEAVDDIELGYLSCSTSAGMLSCAADSGPQMCLSRQRAVWEMRRYQGFSLSLAIVVGGRRYYVALQGSSSAASEDAMPSPKLGGLEGLDGPVGTDIITSSAAVTALANDRGRGTAVNPCPVALDGGELWRSHIPWLPFLELTTCAGDAALFHMEMLRPPIINAAPLLRYYNHLYSGSAGPEGTFLDAVVQLGAPRATRDSSEGKATKSITDASADATRPDSQDDFFSYDIHCPTAMPLQDIMAIPNDVNSMSSLASSSGRCGLGGRDMNNEACRRNGDGERDVERELRRGYVSVLSRLYDACQDTGYFYLTGVPPLMVVLGLVLLQDLYDLLSRSAESFTFHKSTLITSTGLVKVRSVPTDVFERVAPPPWLQRVTQETKDEGMQGKGDLCQRPTPDQRPGATCRPLIGDDVIEDIIKDFTTSHQKRQHGGDGGTEELARRRAFARHTLSSTANVLYYYHYLATQVSALLLGLLLGRGIVCRHELFGMLRAVGYPARKHIRPPDDSSIPGAGGGSSNADRGYGPATGSLELHTDKSWLTLLLTSTCGGLSFLEPDGRFYTVSDSQGRSCSHCSAWRGARAAAVPLCCFIVNVGDALQTATRGSFVSRPHRARNDATTGTSFLQHTNEDNYMRLSLPLFLEPAPGHWPEDKIQAWHAEPRDAEDKLTIMDLS